MSLISLVYPTKHIIYPNLGEIGEMPCPTLFGGYVEGLLRFQFVFEPRHDKTNKVTMRPAKTDQPGYPPSLIRVFAVR